MIDDYCIVEDDEKVRMRSKVMELIREGWEPLGGVNVLCIESIDGSIDTWFAQAMVIRSDEAKAARGVTA